MRCRIGEFVVVETVKIAGIGRSVLAFKVPVTVGGRLERDEGVERRYDVKRNGTGERRPDGKSGAVVALIVSP